MGTASSAPFARFYFLLFPAFYVIAVSITFELVMAFTIEKFMQYKAEDDLKKKILKGESTKKIPNPMHWLDSMKLQLGKDRVLHETLVGNADFTQIVAKDEEEDTEELEDEEHHYH